MILSKNVWLTAFSLLIVGAVFLLTTTLLPNLTLLSQAFDRGGLARVLEADQVKLLLRTRSSRVMESATTILRIDGETPILPERGHFELALLTRSGVTLGAVAAVDQFGNIVSVRTAGISIDSPLAASRPLSRDMRFRQLSNSHDDLLWLRPEAVIAFPILHALLSPASDVSVRWSEDGQSGTLSLMGANVRSGFSAPPIPASASGSDILFRGSITLPGWFGESWSMLEATDPALAEGFRGIALAFLKRETDSTDLAGSLSLLRGQTISILLGRDRGGSITPFIAGSVRSPQSLNALLAMLRSRNAVGEVRTIDLLGENIRTDIRLADGDGSVTRGDWKVVPLSSGILLAARDLDFLLGSAETIAATTMSSVASVPLSGVVDLPWAIGILDLPPDILRTVLGAEAGSIAWQMIQRGGVRTLEWAFR